jgi:Flp pilus assembly pilin Flp
MIQLQGTAAQRHIETLLRVQREAGQAMVEYALILALITIASIAVLQLMGVDVSRVLGNVNNRLSAIAT